MLSFVNSLVLNYNPVIMSKPVNLLEYKVSVGSTIAKAVFLSPPLVSE